MTTKQEEDTRVPVVPSRRPLGSTAEYARGNVTP
jgi:hypothetical protein